MNSKLINVGKVQKIDLSSLYGEKLIVLDVSAVMRTHYRPLGVSRAFNESLGVECLTDPALSTYSKPVFYEGADGQPVPYVEPPAYVTKYQQKPLSYVVNDKIVNTSSLFGILRLVADLSSPDTSFVFCFDNAHNLRKEENKDYKKGRAKVQSDYFEQVNIAKELFNAAGFLVQEAYGYEGDDLVVETARRNKDTYDHVVVVSNDYDLSQVVDENVYFKNVLSKRGDITKENFEVATGCPYNSILLYKALVGDTSDKIVGVKGFGPKRFEKFLVAENLVGNTENIRSSNLERSIIAKATSLKEDEKTQAGKALWLVSPKIPEHFSNYTPRKKINKMLLTMFLEEYGMKSIIKKLNL